jgi:elongation factor P hydroxylase
MLTNEQLIEIAKKHDAELIDDGEWYEPAGARTRRLIFDLFETAGLNPEDYEWENI